MIQGGIIQAALELIKEKEKQGDKACDRIDDGMKQQQENLNANSNWTGGGSSPQKSQPQEIKVEVTGEKDDEKKDDEKKQKGGAEISGLGGSGADKNGGGFMNDIFTNINK